MSTSTKSKAAKLGRKAALKTSSYAAKYYQKQAVSQAKERDERPSPRYFYTKFFGTLPLHSEWVSVCCCFHEDRNPSLSLNLKSGGFFCHGCQAKGGDLVDFLRLHSATDFTSAVSLLKQLQKEEKSCL